MVGFRQPLLCLGQTECQKGRFLEVELRLKVSQPYLGDRLWSLLIFFLYFSFIMRHLYGVLTVLPSTKGGAHELLTHGPQWSRGWHPSAPHPAYLVLATVTGRLLRQRFLSWVPWTTSQRWGGSFNFACMCPCLQVHTCIFLGSGVLGFHCTL